MELGETDLAALRAVATDVGLSRLGVVRLDHPAIARSADVLDAWVAADKHGEMAYMANAADVRRNPARLLDGAQTAFVAVVPYRGVAGPVARYAQSVDYHTEMHRRFEALAACLEVRIPGIRTRVCVDSKPVLERTLAALAGLGFLGKNGCVITPGLGSYILLGELLCTARWTGEDAVPVDRVDRLRWDACGSCTRCLDACPTAAFDGPGQLDPRRCISYLTLEHRGAIDPALADGMGERVAGCDVCQEVCPYNHGARETRVSDHGWLPDPPEARTHDVLALASLRSGRYRAWVRGTALRRIPRRALRRNAWLALGNRTQPLDAQERAAALTDRDDDDSQIRAAAERALKRRG